VVVGVLQRRLEHGLHVVVEGVAHVGPVERQLQHAVVEIDEERSLTFWHGPDSIDRSTEEPPRPTHRAPRAPSLSSPAPARASARPWLACCSTAGGASPPWTWTAPAWPI